MGDAPSRTPFWTSLALGGAGLLASSVVGAAATLDPVVDGVFSLRITEVATPKPAPQSYNFAAPVVIDGALHIVDQFGEILRENGSGGYDIALPAGSLPDGVTGFSSRTILNIADGPGSDVFVSMSSTQLPDDLTPIGRLPDDPAYGTEPRSPLYQILYRYSRNSDGRLTDPRPLTAFEMAPWLHAGGGMLGLASGDLLYATGDSLGFDRDGLSAPQETGLEGAGPPGRGSHLGKILLIDGETGEARVVANGVRNVQRLAFADPDQSRIAFADLGANTAEEINTVTIAALLDDTTVENFGWGSNADGKAREGTFYIDPSAALLPGESGMAPVPEDGFLQPYAQFGRDPGKGVAVSGPVAPMGALDGIVAVFGDLATGNVYATAEDFETAGAPVTVFRVQLVGDDGRPVTLEELAGGRADPRFFSFANGTPGVLLESTGTLYRFSDPTPVPLPAGIALLAAALLSLITVQPSRRPKSDARP